MPRASLAKPIPDLSYETRYWSAGHRLVAGTDECGRGPLCGPVVAGAVILHPESRLEDFHWARDSKTLAERKIAEYALRIRSGSLLPQGLLAWGLGAASPREIDHHNVRQASIRAMQRALEAAERKLCRDGLLEPGERVDFVLVDGLPIPELAREHEGIVKGDARSVSISLGALIAKQARDQLMVRLAARYPQYACWARDKGYPSPAHLAALATHGPIPRLHRMSFSPISQGVLF